MIATETAIPHKTVCEVLRAIARLAPQLLAAGFRVNIWSLCTLYPYQRAERGFWNPSMGPTKQILPARTIVKIKPSDALVESMRALTHSSRPSDTRTREDLLRNIGHTPNSPYTPKIQATDPSQSALPANAHPPSTDPSTKPHTACSNHTPAPTPETADSADSPDHRSDTPGKPSSDATTPPA